LSVEYIVPDTLADACRALEAQGAQCLAGGQSLVAMMNLGLAAPERLVSLRRIAALRGIATARDGGLRIGAMTTHAELARLRSDVPGAMLLAQAARLVAYPAIRNRGTIGGSVALADPAADYPVALVAADATIELASAGRTRDVPARDFFRNMFETALAQGEIVAAIRIPPGAGGGTAYEKLSLVAGDFAILSVAAIVGRDTGVAIGGYAMRPLLLSGLGVADGGVADIARRLAALGEPPSDHRASAAYRRRVAPELVLRAVRAAAQRALP
jgi:carbon-monoxide dehydrogenase medium subunit